MKTKNINVDVPVSAYNDILEYIGLTLSICAKKQKVVPKTKDLPVYQLPKFVLQLPPIKK